MVTNDGSVKIADFGIAKATQETRTSAYVTATGTTIGTPAYMAPEQAMARDIGPWTDLYSVGCIAYELFTGAPPFHDADTPMAMMLRHISEPLRPAGEIADVDPAISSLDRPHHGQGPARAAAVGGDRGRRPRGAPAGRARPALAARGAAAGAAERRSARERRRRCGPRASRVRERPGGRRRVDGDRGDRRRRDRARHRRRVADRGDARRRADTRPPPPATTARLPEEPPAGRRDAGDDRAPAGEPPETPRGRARAARPARGPRDRRRRPTRHGADRADVRGRARTEPAPTRPDPARPRRRPRAARHAAADGGGLGIRALEPVRGLLADRGRGRSRSGRGWSRAVPARSPPAC